MRLAVVLLSLVLGVVGGVDDVPLHVEITKPSTNNVIDSVYFFVDYVGSIEPDSGWVADSSFAIRGKFHSDGPYALERYEGLLSVVGGTYRVYSKVWLHNPYIHLWAKNYTELREVRSNVIEFTIVALDPIPPPHVVSILPVDDVVVLWGTPAAEVPLVDSTIMVDSRDVPHIVRLEWTIADYDSSVVGDYDAVGVFELPDSVVQSDPPVALVVGAVVTVKATSTWVGSSDLKFETRLYQNFPNPSQEVTTVYFSLGRSEKVVIELYDFLGKRVVVLVNGHYNRGLHTVDVDLRGLAAGIYFYRMAAGAYKAVKTIVVIK